jgi:UDP-glucuronate 4-epimerase
MAHHIFIRALLQDEPIVIYGDGEQSRSNTFIADCVQGVLLAFKNRELSIGEIFNSDEAENLDENVFSTR